MWGGECRRPAAPAAALLVVSVLFASPGCAPPGALRPVADQNAANTQALVANFGLLADASRQLARVQTTSVVQRSRERVAEDLVRLRATIAPSQPSDAELADAGAPWSVALAAEVSALAARLNAAAPDQRPAIAESLADDHAATVDLAIGTPGFSTNRVLRDAVELDALNARILDEPNAGVRAALHTARNRVLDVYLPAQQATRLASRYTEAVERLLAAIDEQCRVASLYAGAIASFTAQAPHGSIRGMLQNQDLRAAAIDLVAQAWGQPTADRLLDRLKRIDDVIGAASIEP